MAKRKTTKKVSETPIAEAPKKRGRPRKTPLPETTAETMGGVTVVEEKIIEPKTEVETAKRKPAKQLDKVVTEKVKSMPQTYVEDTFDVDNNTSVEEVIENDVKVKTKKMITMEALLADQQFQMKLNRLKRQIEFEKSFNSLLDFVNFSKNYRTYFIDNETDEIDVLLYEIVIYFKKKLVKIHLPYADYQKIDAYFETIKTLYNRFQYSEGAIKDDLKNELNNAIAMDRYIRLKLF